MLTATDVVNSFSEEIAFEQLRTSLQTRSFCTLLLSNHNGPLCQQRQSQDRQLLGIDVTRLKGVLTNQSYLECSSIS